MKIIWTELAIEKLEEYADYIAMDKPGAALEWAEKIQELTNNLKQFPQLGRVVPEIGRSEIRELIEGEYRIIYRIDKKVISILTIYHSKQRLKSEEIFRKKIT